MVRTTIRRLALITVALCASLAGCRHAVPSTAGSGGGRLALSPEDRLLLARAVEEWGLSYDPQQAMLRDTLERVAYRYHTTVLEGEVHPTRHSLWYAVALLDVGDEPSRERAVEIIRRVLPLQDRDPASDFYGVWPYYLEEPIAKMSPPDRNWADFNAVSLLEVVNGHKDRLPRDLVADIDSALVRATAAIRKRDVQPSYTNIAIMGTYVTLAMAARTDDPALHAYGMERLRKFHRYTVENGNGFAEYNSPTYTVVALKELGRLRRYIDDPEARPIIEDLYRRGWEEIAHHFHAPSRQWSGPHSRSYESLLQESRLRLIQRSTAGRVDFGVAPELDLGETGYRIPLPAPRDLEPYFTALAAPRTLVRALPRADVVGTTYLHPAFTISSADQSNLWNQRRALLAYWGTPDAPSYLHMRLLHDGYDLSAGQMFSSQREGDVLVGVTFATDGGDRHPSLDPIRNSTIRARDLRLRFELGGAAGRTLPNAPAALGTPARLDLGGARLDVAIPYASFDGFRPHWEAGRDERTAWLDVVLYQGEERAIDMSTLRNAAVGAAIRMTADLHAAAPDVRATATGGTLELSWESLRLAFPLRPARAQALRNAVRR